MNLVLAFSAPALRLVSLLSPVPQVTPIEASLGRLSGVAGKIVIIEAPHRDREVEVVAACGGAYGRADRLDLISLPSGRVVRTLLRAAADDYIGEWDVASGSERSILVAIGDSLHDSNRGRCLLTCDGHDVLCITPKQSEVDDRFGVGVIFAGDLNADGYPDLVVGAPQSDLSSNLNTGVVGASGSGLAKRLRFADGREIPERAYWQAQLEKRSSKPGFVASYSGRDGHELWRSQGTLSGHGFGAFVHALGDVDRDGIIDIVAQSDLHSDCLAVVLSGKTGARLKTLQPKYGLVLPIGDLDHDGSPDYALEETDTSLAGRLGASLLSGASGRLIRRHAYMDLSSSYAVVRALGDIDRDGWDDFGIGDADFNLVCPEENRTSASCLGSMSLARALELESSASGAFVGGSGCAVVFSGKTQLPIFGVWAPAGTGLELGRDIIAVPDISGDDMPDLIVSAYGVSYVFAGPGKGNP